MRGCRSDKRKLVAERDGSMRRAPSVAVQVVLRVRELGKARGTASNGRWIESAGWWQTDALLVAFRINGLRMYSINSTYAPLLFTRVLFTASKVATTQRARTTSFDHSADLVIGKCAATFLRYVYIKNGVERPGEMGTTLRAIRHLTTSGRVLLQWTPPAIPHSTSASNGSNRSSADLPPQSTVHPYRIIAHKGQRIPQTAQMGR
jgi:hypothetical protein